MNAAVLVSSSPGAEAEAVRWLSEYHKTSSYRWERHTPTTLVCEPRSGFPCYVMALTIPGENGGHRPSLAFTAGTKQKGRYWQGLLPDKNDPSGLSGEMLSRLDAVLGVLITASQISLDPPR